MMNPLARICCVLIAISVVLESVRAEKTISISKPVIESVLPNLFYWPMDGGLLGTARPPLIEDLSPNILNGHIGIPTGSNILYTEGKYDTALLCMDSPSISWPKGINSKETEDRDPMVTMEDSITIGFWFKPEELKQERHTVVRIHDRDISFIFTLRDAHFRSQGMEGTEWLMELTVRTSKFEQLTFVTPASTGVFADGEFHHLGVSFSPHLNEGYANTVFWLDGKEFDRIQLPLVPAESAPGRLYIRVGHKVWGVIDDIFATKGVYSFSE